MPLNKETKPLSSESKMHDQVIYQVAFFFFFFFSAYKNILAFLKVIWNIGSNELYDAMPGLIMHYTSSLNVTSLTK